MGFNSGFKGLRCRWRYSYVSHVDEWEEEVLKLHELLTYIQYVETNGQLHTSADLPLLK